MRSATRQWLVYSGAALGAVAIGSGAVLWGRSRRKPPLPPPPIPTPPITVDGFAVIPGALGGGAGPQSGSIRKNMPGGSGGNFINDREIYIGPFFDEMPPGRVLVVDFRLTIPGQPAALPGSVPSPCRAVGKYLEVDDDKHVRVAETYWPSGCDRLYQTGGSDYDVHFPDVKIVRRADGIFLRYTWINFRRSYGPVYDAFDYVVEIDWELV